MTEHHIRIVVCDDQAVIRDGLSVLLGLEPDLAVVGLARNGQEAILLAAAQQPTVMLMDLKMPGINGVEATRHISAQSPQIRVLILTTYADDPWVVDALRAGAAGYLLKDTPRQELLRAIRGTAAGQSYLDPQVAGTLIRQTFPPPSSPRIALPAAITARERAILRLLARGRTNQEIATQLALAEGTVRNQLSAILAKLGVSDRTQAALLALQAGLGDNSSLAD